MKNKLFTIIMLAMVLTLQAFCSEAATFRTRLTLTISHGTPSHEISPDLLNNEGIFTGSHTDSQSHIDELGRSITETVTEFRNVDGELLLSVDAAITARSDDFTVNTGELFAETLSVDVEVWRYDEAYNTYAYTLEISGMPAWLSVDGELVSSDTLSADITSYHHEFTISGRPANAGRANLTFTARVLVSGDWPAMMAEGSKNVKISAEGVPKPPDEEPPEEVPEVSPDVVPKSEDISPDVEPSPPDTSPDVEPNPPDETESPPGSISEMLSNMTPEQIAAVTSLTIDGNITSLAGIEAFTNLERLDLTGAVGLVSADLRGLTNLKSLDVAGNTAITALNLAGTMIETLDARGCSQLEELDVSGCTNLRSLNVSYTPMKTLNASDCSSLEVLNCSNCRLEELNITGCDSLNVIDCSNNRLHKFDAYTFSKLDELLCGNQNITGWKLGRLFNFLDYFVMKVSAADDSGADDSGIENITDLKAWDADGQELAAKYDPATGWAEFSGVPAKLTYDYITGFNNVLMDVTIFAAEQENAAPIDPGNAGGCSTLVLSFSALALLLLMRKR